MRGPVIAGNRRGECGVQSFLETGEVSVGSSHSWELERCEWCPVIPGNQRGECGVQSFLGTGEVSVGSSHSWEPENRVCLC